MSVKIRVYTRTVDADSYPAGLANSVHFSCIRGDAEEPLNLNYGILFAEGDVTELNTIRPKGVKDPRIFCRDDGTICITAERILEYGDPDESAAGQVLMWTTKDLIHFKEAGLVPAVTGIGNEIEIDESIAARALEYYCPTVDADPTPYPFPLAEGYGDPVLFKWEDKWYYISTNDNLNDIGIYVRQSDDIPGLFTADAVEHLILPFDPARGFEQTFWAPEFHVIGGRLYILFAVSGHIWGPQCHMMRLKPGASIIDPDGWEDPVRVVRRDGSPLADGPITLDMTYVKADSGSYVIWSYRENIGKPEDSGSMLYIASIDDSRPWQLTSDPVLLTRPLYGWENVEGTINNEGPYALIRDKKVYITYSGGSANAYTYALGLLSADSDSDLTQLSSWHKNITPVLTFYSVEGEFGPGHNSFFTNDDGETMIAYHAETAIDEHLRCDTIHRVHFRDDGTPCFQVRYAG